MKHEEMVSKLCKSGEVLLQEFTTHKAVLVHHAMGISGEAGELLDAVKKHFIYNKQLDMMNIIEELGDLEFYMEGLRQELNISREETIGANIVKLSKRYNGFNYTDTQAHERNDKK